MNRVFCFDLGGKLGRAGAGGAYNILLRDIDGLVDYDTKPLVIGCREEDSTPSEHWMQLLELQKYINDRGMKFILFFNYYTQYLDSPDKDIAVDYLDFMLAKTIVNSPSTDSVTIRGNKILFLTGKPNGMHRAPLLYKFYKDKKLNQLIWSLFVPSELEDTVRTSLGDITDQSWQEFLSLKGSPDNITCGQKSNTVNYYGFPYNRNLYLDTNVSLISESMFADGWPRATEKTYRAIHNRHPFVIAGPCGTLAILRDLGYQTFEEYLPHPAYDTESNNDLRLHMVYENVLALNERVAREPNLFLEQTNHNYNCNINRYHSDMVKLDKACKDNGLSGGDVSILLMHDLMNSNNASHKLTEYIS